MPNLLFRGESIEISSSCPCSLRLVLPWLYRLRSQLKTWPDVNTQVRCCQDTHMVLLMHMRDLQGLIEGTPAVKPQKFLAKRAFEPGTGGSKDLGAGLFAPGLDGLLRLMLLAFEGDEPALFEAGLAEAEEGEYVLD